MKEFQINQLATIASEIIQKARMKKGDTAVILALSGDLGAGKTTLSKEIARMLGVKENVMSPTFVIMKRYSVHDTVFRNLIHIDAYRLKSSDELEKLGWSEFAQDPENIILVEWPEHVAECLKKNVYKINLSHSNDQTRGIEILI